jgi:hypothetical protein
MTLEPWFRTREDYEAIRRLVTDEPQLFDTFDQWLEAANKFVEKLTARGKVVKKVFIDPQEFTTWCLRSNISYSSVALQAFTAGASLKQ